MKTPNFRYIYSDTNVVSNIVKQGGIVNDFFRHFPPGENNLLCFSTYTLYEVNKSKTLMSHFRKLYSLFPCAILFSYFPLGKQEVESIGGIIDCVDPVLLTPQAISVEGQKIHPDVLDIVLQTPSVLDAFEFTEKKMDDLFYEYSNLLDTSEFSEFRSKPINRNKFVETFKLYELKHRFFGGNHVDVDKAKLAKLKTLEVLGQGIYYKFYSDKQRRISKSDVVDILIMTTAPYCDTFISEANSIDIYRKIVNMNKCSIKTNYMTLSELRK